MRSNTPRTVHIDNSRAAGTQHGQQSSRHTVGPSNSSPSFSGRPSQMQIALPCHQYSSRSSESQSSSWSRASQMQVVLPGYRFDEPPRSTSFGRPSQMQVALPGHHHSTSSRLPRALPGVNEYHPSRYDASPRQSYSSRPWNSFNNTARPIEPTAHADRPRTDKTVMLRPRETHHFGAQADHARGNFTCTLCRCVNPNSHGDAYTMLNSLRGNDIHGCPIDWQESKRRMLHHYGKDQISYAEENAAVPYVFDAENAREILEAKKDLERAVRAGYDVSINFGENNVDWHNYDGHATPYVTGEGAKTRFGR